MSYLFLKWAHLVSIVCWMAGLLYIYRLFVYHLEYGLPDEKIHNFLMMAEKRLLFIITKPAMLGAWVFGLWMIWENPGLFAGKWLHIKIAFVLFLTFLTIYANILRRSFINRAPLITNSRKLRIFNEVPAVLMMVIIALAVFRPL